MMMMNMVISLITNEVILWADFNVPSDTYDVSETFRRPNSQQARKHAQKPTVQ